LDTSHSSATLQTALNTQLTPFVQQVVESFGLAGLATGVVKAGELLYAQGFGVRNLDTREPITPRTLFHLASVSKPFVATAVIQLAERGKLALDAPVSTYLPYFRLKDARAGDITIRQMLSHTSGMPDEVDYRWYAPEDDDAALERYVRSLADEELVAAPGEKYAYSNIAFEVLGDVIAKVSGETFETYIKTHILTPLEMHTSTFLRREVALDRAATPHFGAPLQTLAGAYPYHRAHAPSSSLHTSIEELSQWAIGNMRRGRFKDQQFIRSESYDELWREHVRTGEEGWDEAVGLSWFFGTYRGRPVVYCNGSDPGFGSELVIVPDADAAVLTLVNANTAATGVVTDAALDLLLGETLQRPTSPITVPIAATLAVEGPEAAIAQYKRLQDMQPGSYDAHPGRFMDAVWGALEVARADEVLPFIQLWVELQPDEAQAFEALGWAYAVQGDQQRAGENLRRARYERLGSSLMPSCSSESKEQRPRSTR
jgi:CubicO group peptidase (beta-lactamase class C family)